MKRRRRDRVDFSDVSRRFDDSFSRSVLAHRSFDSSPLPRNSNIVDRRIRNFRQAEPVRRNRLRNSVPFKVNDIFAVRMHGNVRSATDCVKSKLQEFSGRSGTGSKKSRGRSKSRRQLFIAARKSC